MEDSPRLEVPPWVLDWLHISNASRSTLDDWRLDPEARGSEERRLRSLAQPFHQPSAATPYRDEVGEEPGLTHAGLRLVSVRIPGAARLSATHFESSCFEAYRRLQHLLLSSGAAYPIRMWNFIPGILEPLGNLRHRYMVFNAGRFRAIKKWLDGRVCQVATASGVGHHGEDLVIHCLAASRAGQPVENPRQIPAYRYSQRYGPIPPCFARATRWSMDGADPPAMKPWLLVGGTASVRGEDSLFADDLDRQLEETLRNLAALADAGLSNGHIGSNGSTSLTQFQNFRVYYVDPDHRELIEQGLERRLPRALDIEYRRADLCRPDLLVEIEGLAGGVGCSAG